MKKQKKKHVDKALRKALSGTLRSQPDPAPGWNPGELEEPDRPAVEYAHGAPIDITSVTLEHREERAPDIAPPENAIDLSATKNKP